MTDIEEKAEASPEVDLVRQSAPGVYRLETTELVGADDLTGEGSFPQYGDFLRVSTSHGGENPQWDAEQYIECPQALAQWLVDHEVGEGDAFRIRDVTKVDGEWQYDAVEIDPDLPNEE